MKDMYKYTDLWSPDRAGQNLNNHSNQQAVLKPDCISIPTINNKLAKVKVCSLNTGTISTNNKGFKLET